MQSWLRKPVLVLVGLCGTLWTACASEEALGPKAGPPISLDDSPQLAGQIQPMCQLGCLGDDDPPSDPPEDGISVGAELTATFCADTTISNDVDEDGMSDFCEKVLAEAFAPMIRYANTDDLSRESYWAARALAGGKVRLFYAIAYYFDLGVPETFPPCYVVECPGHHGDSEHIVLDIYFNASTGRWILDHAWYSHHETPYNEFDRGHLSKKAYPQALTYPGNLGGYPLSWVARGKHANYSTQSACNDGGGGGSIITVLFPWDDCTGNNSMARLDALGSRNLGSNGHRLIDCVSSVNPFYQDPPHPQECFWSAGSFYGWDLDHSTDSPGYGGKLRSFGF